MDRILHDANNAQRILKLTADTMLLVDRHGVCVDIEIGENFYANMNCVILDEAKVTFGDNVFIAPSCGFYTAGHPLDVEQRNRGLEYARPIRVGNNVWTKKRSV